MDHNQEKLLKEMINKKRFDYNLLATVMNYGLKVWKNILSKRNFKDILEINDGYCVVYHSYNAVIEEFIKYRLDPSMFLVKFASKIWQIGNNYITSLSGNHHHVLNKNFKDEYSEDAIYDKNNKEEPMIGIEAYQYYSSFCENKLQGEIFQLKAKGFSNQEIANQRTI